MTLTGAGTGGGVEEAARRRGTADSSAEEAARRPAQGEPPAGARQEGEGFSG